MGAIKKFKLKRVINGGSNNSTKYWGKFTYQKKDGTREEVTLTQGFEVIKGNAPLNGKKIFEFNFRTAGLEYELIVDSDNKAQQLFLEALRLDPKIHSKGELQTGHLYQLVDEHYETIQTALEIKKRANVTQKIYAMGMKQLSELCYFMVQNIQGKSKQEIYGLLLHPITGKVFSKSLRAENNYVDMILSENFGGDFNVRSSVNKAIILGIIKQNNGTYQMGTTIVGTTIDSVYSFFTQNSAVFTSGLLPELESKDVLPENIDYDGELEDIQEDIKQDQVGKPFLGENGKLTEEKRAELLKRVEELGALGYKIQGNVKNFSDSVLIEKVTRAEGLLAQKQNM